MKESKQKKRTLGKTVWESNPKDLRLLWQLRQIAAKQMLNDTEVADLLGITCSHMSRLYNNNRALTEDMKWRISDLITNLNRTEKFPVLRALGESNSAYLKRKKNIIRNL